MATAETAQPLLETCFAPEDPNLLKPWKGLIDGSTGHLYYWNPETNATQYERPAAMPLPSPIGAFSASAVPKLAPLPSHPSNERTAPQGQEMLHHHGQQPLEQENSAVNQMGNLQDGQHLLQQHQGLQMHQQQGHQMLLPFGQQFSYQQPRPSQYPQGQQSANPHYLQAPSQPVQQNPHQQAHHLGQREEFGFRQGEQCGFPSSDVRQAGFSYICNPVGNHPIQPAKTGFHSVHSQPATAGSSTDGPHPGGSFAQMQQSVVGSAEQNRSWHVVPSHTGPTVIQNQQAVGGAVLNKIYDEVPHGRSGNNLYFGGNMEQKLPIAQQAAPVAHKQQELRTGTAHPQNVMVSRGRGPNNSAGPPLPNRNSNSSAGQAFSTDAHTRPSPRILGTPDLSNLSPAEAYRQQHDIAASGDNVPVPFMTFEATGFPPEILREMHTAGFSSPTPIQAQTWPIALQSRDIVAIAKTGSGKTLGYIIPAFIHLRHCRNSPQVGPTVLVLSPTRELATQIQDEVVKFGRSSRVSCTCLYGGASKGLQLRELERGADIIVATPGRLNDILEMKKISLHQVSFLVLDEADRMLDMGFEPQIRKIVNEIPSRRQTLMYTATWPKEVRKIAGDLLVNPVQVNIGSIDELAANKSITQYVEVLPQMEKQRRLEQILRSQERGSKVIIFCSTKRVCDQLARSIGRSFVAASIHGKKSQSERDWVLSQFRSGKSPILVATDVAARGLDIKDIRMVINYDFPTGIEDYVHRIGRTGRAGASGISYTFFSDQDWKHAADLVKVLERANQRVPAEVREMAARGGPGFNKGRGGVSRWDSGDHGGRDGGFGGRGGGRNELFGGRGNRGRGFNGGGGPGGRGWNDRGPHDRYAAANGRSRFDHRRSVGERRRGRSRSYSPSPDRVRTWDHRNDSRSRSRSRSWSRSRSRSCSRSRSHSLSYDRCDKSHQPDPIQNLPVGCEDPAFTGSPRNEPAGRSPACENSMPEVPTQHPEADA